MQEVLKKKENKIEELKKEEKKEKETRKKKKEKEKKEKEKEKKKKKKRNRNRKRKKKIKRRKEPKQRLLKQRIYPSTRVTCAYVMCSSMPALVPNGL